MRIYPDLTVFKYKQAGLSRVLTRMVQKSPKIVCMTDSGRTNYVLSLRRAEDICSSHVFLRLTQTRQYWLSKPYRSLILWVGAACCGFWLRVASALFRWTDAAQYQFLNFFPHPGYRDFVQPLVRIGAVAAISSGAFMKRRDFWGESALAYPRLLLGAFVPTVIASRRSALAAAR